MLLSKLVIIIGIILGGSAQVTKLDRRNVFLSRKKRYLQFPKNSNFVMTMSFVKPLMVAQPRGMIILGECDVPFPLPQDTRKVQLFKRRSYYRQRREIFSDIEAAFTLQGFNGTACLKRMICEAQQYVVSERKSLVRDLLTAMFTSLEPEFQGQYDNVCYETSFTECTMSFMSHILASILPT